MRRRINHTLRGDATSLSRVTLNRNRFFVGLWLVGFINGSLVYLVTGLRENSALYNVLNTFEISAIVWVSIAVGCAYLFKQSESKNSRRDVGLAIAISFAFLIPITALSWVAVSVLSAYLIVTSPGDSYAKRGAWILFTVTVPMFWSRVIFSVLSEHILQFDAILVSNLLDTERAGNAVAFADGSGYLWIAPGCSSLMNVSLAVLCGTVFSQMWPRKRPLQSISLVAFAAAAVVMINAVRLALIGTYPQYFETLHGSVGATVTDLLTLIALVSICSFGVRNELKAK
ncbi:hypothetical protein G5V57_31500 [Nordella sp. HKS 07]|uniref:archaeosortase/exosortase family protein n=1 Tax=Nordella sp. HKS 07 TaxID=2712222 RepID=UPI0013E1B4A6|nr:archaeosortase/exosortase family protein [Nordella sp. HKS 07]QIG51836.1 hypothetical protein G5V57_31500 [Nordella sp. HKS 07]